jgi:VWFA-related protein
MTPGVIFRGLLLATCVVTAQAQGPTFRSGVDLVAVEVQVVDPDGQPVAGLSRDDFTVSIQGRRRRVASVELLRFDRATDDTPPTSRRPTAAAAAPFPAAARSAPGDARVYVLAVDTMSFRPAATLPLVQAAREFVAGLQPNDVVGVVPFPIDGTTDLTTDHGSVLAALEKIAGTRMADGGNCRLNPSDITDFTTVMPGAPIPQHIARRIGEIEATAGGLCNPVAEAKALALMEEVEIAQRLGSLRSMLHSMAASPRRKTIVLLSAGIISADGSGGRPDIGLDLGTIVGQDAARANATIYTLWVDNLRRDASQASTRGAPRTTDNYQRDAMLVSAPLDRITANAGGALFSVIQGGGEFAFDRILRETSAYYLLGVEPDDEDRDGRPKTLQVRIDDLPRGAAVRARSWVVIPRMAVAAGAGNGDPPREPGAAAPPARPATAEPTTSTTPATGTAPAVAPERAEPSRNLPDPTLRPVTDATLAPLLARAAAYVDRFTAAFSNVVVTERYVQDVTGAGGLLSRTAPATIGPRHRELRSELVFLRSAGPLGWQAFRDVFEVDGVAVRDRADRLTRLFEDGAADSLDQASRIARESARYNIGAADRTINSPVVALLFLQADQQPRFAFSRGERAGAFSDRVDVIAFQETERPTIIRTVQDADRPSSGRIWIERDTGAVLQTELMLTGAGISVTFTTMFRQDQRAGVAVPYRLEEAYVLASGRLAGVATYDEFRRFTVRTDTSVSPGSPR